MSTKILVLDPDHITESNFTRRQTGCVVLTSQGKILLQKRPLNWRTFPGCLATFGGEILSTESPAQALARELKEELGADVDINELVFLGAITEQITNHLELIYAYFWHDRNNSITGCYEGSAIFFEDSLAPLKDPHIMDDVRWMLRECQNRKLIN